MNRVLLMTPGVGRLPIRVVLRRHWLPKLLGHAYTTLGRTVLTTVTDAIFNPATHVPSLRHEGTHVLQQRRWAWWPFWVAWYLIWAPFRHRMEAEARAAEWAEWPKFI